jgi:hypothetical protein
LKNETQKEGTRTNEIYITSRGMGGGRMEVMRGWEYTGRDERVDSFLHISFCVF